MHDRFFHLDIYRNNEDRLTYRFLLDFPLLFFSSAYATSLEEFLTFIVFYFFDILLIVPSASSRLVW